MKKYRGLIALAIFLLVIVGGVMAILQATAEYPEIESEVSYPVNQIEGFVLSIDDPAWSPFRGYSIRYNIALDSKDVYYLETGTGSEGPERLEKLADGQWHRLKSKRNFAWNPYTFDLGGEGDTGLSGSLVQKYNGYGTRLEPGTYRLTIALRDSQNQLHYLASEFTLD